MQRVITLIFILNFLTVDILAQNTVTYRLLITSTPGQADVYLDGERVGITPFSARLAAGAYLVRVSKEGHDLWEQRVMLQEDIRLNAALTFRQPKRNLSWLWGVLTLAVIGAGVAGIVSVIKKQSDNSGSSGPELPGSPPGPP